MNHADSLKPTELPVACTLEADDGARRLKRWRALSARAAPVVRREGDALVLAYPAGPGVLDELELLAAAERRCCAFAQWDVLPEVDRVLLRITAHAEGLAAIAALFGVDWSTGCGSDTS